MSANTGSLTISVIPASSTGGFQPKTDYPTPGAPVAVAVGDTNYDARLDVATACVSPYVISHRLNIGGGALGAATDYPTAAIPASVHYLDWNGDGWHDLASVTTSGTVVSMRLGDGSGAFGARHDFAGNPFASGTFFGVSTSRISAVADLDADGRSDLAIVTSSALATLLNRQPPALGTSLYGGGTPGCVGALGVSISAPPSVGTTIRFMPTNAPDRTFGLGVISTGQNLAGIDFFGIGMLCHVDFAALTLLAFDAPTDPAGTGFVGFTIPNNPALVGATGYFQSFFLTSVCKPSPFGLMSSRGLAFTIQP